MNRLPSREHARYAIFWSDKHNTVRCCFPSLDAAIRQASKFQRYCPEYIIDLCTNQVVAERSAWQLVTPGVGRPKQDLGSVE